MLLHYKSCWLNFRERNQEIVFSGKRCAFPLDGSFGFLCRRISGVSIELYKIHAQINATMNLFEKIFTKQEMQWCYNWKDEKENRFEYDALFAILIFMFIFPGCFHFQKHQHHSFRLSSSISMRNVDFFLYALLFTIMWQVCAFDGPFNDGYNRYIPSYLYFSAIAQSRIHKLFKCTCVGCVCALARLYVFIHFVFIFAIFCFSLLFSSSSSSFASIVHNTITKQLTQTLMILTLLLAVRA